ncbi:11415_t:CDS:2 [Entrophospora sp. SA101]|nr:11415_t:CDS:2 [Entrophospora sp. SA101]
MTKSHVFGSSKEEEKAKNEELKEKEQNTSKISHAFASEDEETIEKKEKDDHHTTKFIAGDVTTVKHSYDKKREKKHEEEHSATEGVVSGVTSTIGSVFSDVAKIYNHGKTFLTFNEEKENLSKQILQIKDEYNDLIKEKDKTIAEFKESIAIVKLNNISLTNNNNDLNSKMSEKDAANDKLRKETIEYQNLYSTLVAKYNDLVQEYNNLKEELIPQIAMNVGLTETNIKYEKQYNQYVSQLNRLKKHNSELQLQHDRFLVKELLSTPLLSPLFLSNIAFEFDRVRVCKCLIESPLANEEKLHNEHLNELDKQVKKIGKDYEKKSKKDSKSSLESHDKYISSLTTVGSDIARARAEYMNQAIRRERSTHCVISQIICKIAEGNFAYFNDSLKKCGPFISKMKEWVPFAGEDMPQPLDLDSFLEDQALRSDDNSINSDKTLPEPYPNISEKKSSSTPNLLNYINNNSQLSFYSSPNSLPPLPQFTVEPNDIEVPKYTQTPEEIQKPLLPIDTD